MSPLNQLRAQLLIRWMVSAVFVGMGIAHFTHDQLLVGIMPPYLPWHYELVWLSGAFEILGGIGILLPEWRRFSAWGLLALLVAVFPANVHMAVNEVYLDVDWLEQTRTGLWARLPFQFVFAWAVYWAGLVEIDVPDEQPGS